MMEKRVSDIGAREMLAVVGAALQDRKGSSAHAASGPGPSHPLSWPHGEIEPTMPSAFADGEPELQIRNDRRYAIGDFTRFHDRAFVVSAYRGVFGRRPDAAGLAHYVELLRAGRSKVEILGRLRYSNEGKRIGATIAHLHLRYAKALAQELPLIGAFVTLCEWLVRGATTRRSIRRLEAHTASLVDLQARQLRDLAATMDRNVRLLEERVEALRRH